MTQEWPPEKISKIRKNIKAGYVDGKMTEKQQLSALDEIERLQKEDIQKNQKEYILSKLKEMKNIAELGFSVTTNISDLIKELEE